MSNTLPPGWVGNDAEHHRTIGVFRLAVRRGRLNGPFHGPTYRASVLGATVGDALGYRTAAAARRAAYLALRVLLLEATQDLDYAAANGDPAASISTPPGVPRA